MDLAPGFLNAGAKVESISAVRSGLGTVDNYKRWYKGRTHAAGVAQRGRVFDP